MVGARCCGALQHLALCSGPVTVQRILRGLHGSQQKSLNWLSMRRPAGAAAASACDSADHPDLHRRPNTAPEMVSRPCPPALRPRCRGCQPTLCRLVRDGRHDRARSGTPVAGLCFAPSERPSAHRTAPHRTVQLASRTAGSSPRPRTAALLERSVGVLGAHIAGRAVSAHRPDATAAYPAAAPGLARACVRACGCACM